METSYRPEIDGLRALAVLAVIAFHAGLPFASGGYLGVDIFFVISGYLITRLIVNDVSSGRFSFRKFYLRRIRRIIPALLLTIVLTIPLAWMVMVPDQLQNYGQSVVATVVMANNILLHQTRGYWSDPVEYKPLSHTWSLGVEEQFYLLFPLVMVAIFAVFRSRPRLAAGYCIAAVVLLSLALTQMYSDRFAFLMLPTRAWELGVGALVALLPSSLQNRGASLRELVALIGALAMVLPMALFDEVHAIPSPMSTIPVAGCALFIWGATHKGMAGRLFAARPIVAVGLISYSAYLFHQPVFAVIKLLSDEPPAPWLLASLTPLILMLAWASWYWIEGPARDRTRISDKAILAICGGIAAICFALGMMFHLSNGLASSWATIHSDPAKHPVDISDFNRSVRGYLRDDLDPAIRHRNVLVVGDSFAHDALHMAVLGGGVEAKGLALVRRSRCEALLERKAESFADKAAIAIVAFDFDEIEIFCITNLVTKLENAGFDTVRVLGTKRFGYTVNSAAFGFAGGEDGRLALRPPEIRRLNQLARQALPEGVFIDPLDDVSASENRVPVYTKSGMLVSQDAKHVTPDGARWIGEALFARPEFAVLTEN